MKNDSPASAKTIMADPHVVFYDAVLTSSWNRSGGTTLPKNDDWSTYRCASKDIIIGTVTHRHNRPARRLEIRAYFVGEHPIFKAMEPTRILMIILCSQAYQLSGSMHLFFEHGIPFDIRHLIEQQIAVRLSGHEKEISEEIAFRLYASLSSFSSETCAKIEAQAIPIERVCFNTFRGTWSADLIKNLLHRNVPLRWLFKNRPNPLGQSLLYAHFLYHLRAAMMEEQAIHRLADRKLGVHAGRRIQRVENGERVHYLSETKLELPALHESNSPEDDSFVLIEASQPFYLIPILAHSQTTVIRQLQETCERVGEFPYDCPRILILPMDFAYTPPLERKHYIAKARAHGLFLLVLGLTMAQLLAEAEFNLAVTSTQVDDDEVETFNDTRFAD